MTINSGPSFAATRQATPAANQQPTPPSPKRSSSNEAPSTGNKYSALNVVVIMIN